MRTTQFYSRSFSVLGLIAAMVATTTGAQARSGFLYVTVDRTIANGNPIDNSTGGYTGVDVGEDSSANPFYGIHADLVGVQIGNAISVVNDGTVHFTNNSFTQYLYAEDSSTILFDSGVANSGVSVSGTAHLTFTGSAATNDIGTGDTATVTITGGAISNHAGATGNGHLDISGGFVDHVTADTYGTVSFGGTASTNRLFAQENSTITFTGGTISGYLYAANDSITNMSGGYAEEIRLLGNAVVNVTGGSIGPNTIVGLSSAAVTNIFGTGLVYSNPTASTFAGNNGMLWDLSGTLENGDTLSTHYFDISGNMVVPQGLNFNPSGVTVPEGSTVVLLGLALPLIGAVRVARRRKK